MFPKEIQVLKQLSNMMKLMSVIALQLFSSEPLPFMLVIEELAVRVSVEQPLVSPL